MLFIKVGLLSTCLANIIKNFKDSVAVAQRRNVKGATCKQTDNITFGQVKTITKNFARKLKGSTWEVV